MSVLQPQHGGRPESPDPGWRRPVVDRTFDVIQDFGSTGCDDFDGVHGHDSSLALNTLSLKRGTTADA